MSETTTQTVETAHGTVEYETVACDSCGQEIHEDDAREFTIGDREGVACEHCVDEGPAEFPALDRDFDGLINPTMVGLHPLLVAFGYILWSIEPESIDGEMRKYFQGSIATIAWTVPIAVGLHFAVGAVSGVSFPNLTTILELLLALASDGLVLILTLMGLCLAVVANEMISDSHRSGSQ